MALPFSSNYKPDGTGRRRRTRPIARFHVTNDTHLGRLVQSIAKKLRLGLHVRINVPGQGDISGDASLICDRIITGLLALTNTGYLRRYHLDRVRYE